MKKQLARPSLKPAMRVISILVCAMTVLSPSGLLAGTLPTGAAVKAGAVAISTSGNTMTIDQATQKAIVNWDTFNIGASNVVNVNQPNAQAAMLSRVVGGSASEILGRLSATGHFYLVNPHGVLIGKDATIDVNALIASTLNISDSNFLAGNLIFEGASDASVQNLGAINADAAALIGKNVLNAGEINAKQVGLLGTQAVELGNFNGGKLSVDFSGLAESAKAATTVDNTGIINAGAEGDVILFADAGVSSNETGAIIADTLEISGDFVDIFNLGTLDINSLLIDPTGTLTIVEGAAGTYAITDVGPVTATSGDLAGLLGIGNVTLGYDDFVLSNTGGALVTIASSGNNLTLDTNAATGTFAFNADLTYSGGGDLTISTGTFTGASGNIIADGNVSLIGKHNTTALTLPGTVTAGGALNIDANAGLNVNNSLSGATSVVVNVAGDYTQHGDITSAGYIDIDAGGSVTLNSDAVSAATYIDIDAGGMQAIVLGDAATDTITAGTGAITALTLAGNITTNAALTAETDIVLGNNPTDAAAVQVNNTVDATSGDISVVADVIGVNAGNLTAGNDIILDAIAGITVADSDINAGRDFYAMNRDVLDGGGAVVIPATGDVSITSATTNAITAGGYVTIYNDSLDDNIVLSNYNITAGTVDNDGYLWISGNGALNMTNSDLATNAAAVLGLYMEGSIGIAVNKGVTIADSSMNAGTVVSINNVDIFDGPHAYKVATNGISITSTTGDTITAPISINVFNQAGTLLDINNVDLTATADAFIDIESLGSIQITDSALTTAAAALDVNRSGSVNLWTESGIDLFNSTISGTSVLALNQDVFGVLGDITSDDASTITARTDDITVVNQDAGGNITLSSDAITAYTNLIIEAQGGNVTVGDDLTDTATATTGFIDIDATGDITTNATLSANTDVFVTSSGDDVTINNNVTATTGFIDVDAFGELEVTDATLSATAAGADIMLNADFAMTLTNSTLTADDSIWLHTTGNVPYGNIFINNTDITSNNAAVDVYAANANSTIIMDAASSIDAVGTVTMAAGVQIDAGNVNTDGDILLDVANGDLNVIGPVGSTTAGNVYLTANDMDITAAVTTTAGDIYLYDNNQGFALGAAGTGVSLEAAEIALLQANDAYSLIIGRGKQYAPPADILTGMGGIAANFDITAANIAQSGNATAASLNVGLITEGAITRTGDVYLTTVDSGTLALVANDGIAFGATAGGTALDLAAFNQNVPAAAAGDIHLTLGGAGLTYNVVSFTDGTDAVATGLGQNVAGIENQAEGEDIVVTVPNAGNTININAAVFGAAGAPENNDIVFDMAGSDLIQAWNQYITAADGDAFFFVNNFDIGRVYAEAGTVYIEHTGDVSDINDAPEGGPTVNVTADGMMAYAAGTGVFGPGDPIETVINKLQMKANDDVNLVNYGDLTVGGVTVNLDGLAAAEVDTTGIPVGLYGIWQTAGDLSIDVGANRLVIAGTILQAEDVTGGTPAANFASADAAPVFYGGNVTLVGADVVVGAPIRTAMAAGAGGAITLVPTFEHTNFIVTGYTVDGTALADTELGRQWVLDSNYLANLQTDSSITIGQTGHTGSLSFNGMGSDVDLTGAVGSWTFFGGATDFADNTNFDATDLVNLYANGAITGAGTVTGGTLNAESVGGYNLASAFENLNILNREGLVDNLGVTVDNTFDGAVITVRNDNGDVTIANTGALTLGDVATGLASFAKDGDFVATANSPLTVATDIYTIGTGDIILNATSTDDLTVNGGVTINAEAGSVALNAVDGNVVLGDATHVNTDMITIRAAEFLSIQSATGAIEIYNNTLLNATSTVLATGATEAITIDDSRLVLTGTTARFDTSAVTTATNGYLAAELGSLIFDTNVQTIDLSIVDLSIVGLTQFAGSDVTVTATTDINLGETLASGNLTLTGPLMMFGPLTAAGDLTIGEYGAAQRNAFTNAEITAGTIDIKASNITGSTFTAGTTALIDATGNVLESTVMAYDATLTATTGNIAGVDVTAFNDATLDADIVSASTISAGNDATVTGTTQLVDSTIAADGTATLVGADLLNNTVAAGAITATDTSILNIIGGTYTTVGTADLTAAVEIGGVTVQATGDANLTTTTGDIVNTTVEGNVVTLDAGRNITNTAVDAATDAILSANASMGYIAESSVTALNDATLSAFVVSGNTISAGANASVTADTQIVGNTINANGIATLAGASPVDLINNQVAAATIIANTGIGNIIGGTYTSSGDTTLGATVEIGGVTVQAQGAADLTAGADIVNSTVEGSTVVLTAGGNISNTAVEALTTAALTATAGILDASVVAGTTATLGAALIADSSVFAGTDAALTAANIAGTAVTALNDAVLSGDVLSANAISAGNDATLTGTVQVVGNTVDAAATATLIGADLLNNTVAAGAVVANDATIQNIIGGTYTSATTADLAAAIEIGGVTVQATDAATLTTTTGDIVNTTVEGSTVALDAGGNLTNVAVDAVTAADLTAANDVSGTSVTAGGDIEIEATAGTIQGTTALGGGAMTLTAGLEIDGSDFTAAGDLTVTATDLAASSFISEAGNITVNPVTNIIDSTIWAKTGSVTLSGVSGELDGSTISSATDLTLTANWIVGSSLIAEDGLLDVTATTIDGSELLSKLGGIELSVDALNDSSLAAAIDIDVTGADAAISTITTSSMTAATGDVTVDDFLTVNALTVNAGGDALVGTVGSIGTIIGGAYITAGATTLNALGEIGGVTVQATGAADLTSGADIVNSTVEGSTVVLDAAGNISNTAVESLTTSDLTAAGAILGSTVTAGTDATLTAAQIAGTTVDAFGLADLTAAAIGGTTVVAGTGVNVTGTIAESSLTAQTGDIVIDNAVLGITNVTASAGAGAIVATDNIGWVAGGSFIASGDVDLTTTYTIYDALIEGAVVNLTANNADASATGAMANLTVTARDAANLTAVGDITNSSVFAANAATIDLSGDLNNDTVTANSIAITGLVNVENGSYVAKAGSLTVDASGNIEGATFTAETADVVLTAAGNIASSTVTAATDATLTAVQIANSAVAAVTGSIIADGNVLDSTLTALGDVTITNAYYVSNNMVVAGGAIDLTQNVNKVVGGSYLADGTIKVDAGLVASATFDSGSTVTMTASGNIEVVNVKANNGATLTSGAGIDGSTVVVNSGDAVLTAVQIANSAITTESGSVFFTADDLYNLTVTSAGVIDGTAVVGNIVGGSYVAADDITFDAAATIASASFDGSADVTLAASGNIELVGVKANDNATLTSGANIDGATVIANNGDASLTAAGFIANTAVESAGAAALLAGTDVSGTSVTAGGDVAIEATTGTIQGTSALGDGAMALTAGEEIDGSDFTAAGDITVAATDLAASSFISETGSISVGSVANIIDSTIWAKLGAITVTAVTEELDGSTISAATDLTLTANWIVGSSLIAENGTLDVTATTIDGSELLSKDGDAIVTAGSIFGSSITALDPNDAGAGNVDLVADVVVGSGVFAESDLVADIYEIENSTLTAYDTVELYADFVDNVDVFANYGITAEVYEELYGGDWTVYDGDITVDAYMIGATQFTAYGTVSLTTDEFIINAGVTAVDGDAVLAAGTDIIGTTVTASEAASLTAGGLISASTVTTGTTADLTAQLIAATGVVAGDDITTSGSLVNSSLATTADIVITNAATIDNLDAASAGTITAVTAIGTITGGSLISAGATTVSAESIRGTAFDAATADLTAASDIQAITARVDSNAKLSSASIVDSGVLVSQAGGSIEVKATAIDGGTLRADTVSFDEFVAGSDTQVGAVSAVNVLGAESITVANGGLVNIVSENDEATTFTVAASDDVFLTQGNGDMLVDIAAAGQTVTLTAAADILGAVSGTDVTAASLVVMTAENVTLDTDIDLIKANVETAIAINEVSDLSVDLIEAGKSAALVVDGDILDSELDEIIDIVAPAIALTATGSIGTADNALDLSGQALTATADTGLINLFNVSSQNVDVATLEAGTSVFFEANGAGTTEFAGPVTAHDGDVVIVSAQGTLLFEGNVTATGDVSISAAENDVFLYNDLVSAGGDVDVWAEGYLDSYATIEAVEDIVLGAYEEVYLSGDVTSTAGDIDILAGKEIVIGADITAVDGYVDIDATTGFVEIDGAVKAAEDIYVEAGTDVEVTTGGTLEAGEDVMLTAGEDVVVAGAVTAGSDIIVEAGDDAEFTAAVTAGDDMMIEAQEDILVASDLTAADQVGILAVEGDVRQVAGSGAVTGSDVAIAAGDDVFVDEVIADNSVTVTADGKILRANPAGTTADIFAETVSLTAVEGIGRVTFNEDGEPVDDAFVSISGASEVTLVTTGEQATIGVKMADSGTTAVDAYAEGNDSDIMLVAEQISRLDVEQALAKDGDVIIVATGSHVDVASAKALDEGVVNGLEDDAHSVIIEAGSLNVQSGAIVADYNAELDVNGDGDFASDAVLAGNDINISTMGSILDSSDTDAYNLIAAGDITLQVGNMIGDPAGHNPFDVSAGGNVNVGAIDGSPNYTGGSDRIWVFMMGESGDGSINYIGDTSVPPGLIWWNGMVWGGAENPLNILDRAEGGFSREVRDLADRYISYEWFYNFLYFPHVRAYMDADPGNMSIEHILDGEGVIEGLPEGVTPTEFNLNDLDDSYTWYDGSK